jgi:hypothetical protein
MRSIPFSAIFAAVLLAGCGKQQEPLLSHGKPVAYWLDELKKSDATARKKAVKALGHVGKADPEALRALIGAVKDRDASVRDQAVLALLNIGPAVKAAVPVLTEAEHDQDVTVRSHATKALEIIAGGK